MSTISDHSGTSWRWSAGSSVRYASPASTTTGARTSPRGVTSVARPLASFGRKPGDRRPLDDPRPVALDGAGQAAHEPARVDHGRVVGHERLHGPGDPDPPVELGGVDQPVAVAEPEPPVLLERRLERRHALRARARR